MFRPAVFGVALALIIGCAAPREIPPQPKQETQPMSDVEAKVITALAQPQPARWKPTSLTRDRYLDLMEHILETAAAWQDDRGAIIDPVEHIEHGQTSCRFVAPGAILLSAGRGQAIRENVLRGMDYCCSRLARGQGDSPDFWMRELITAWNCLKDDVPAARRAQWDENLRAVIPEKTYRFVSPDGTKLNDLHNWAVYAAAGEAMRAQAGLAPAPPTIPPSSGAPSSSRNTCPPSAPNSPPSACTAIPPIPSPTT